ncbi:MAG: hypothetical protein ACLGIC_09415 [Acidimicrobiia bacterium]
MDTVTGHTLYGRDGEKIGRIDDVLGITGGADEFGWLAVKLSWRATRLVPNQGMEPHEDGFRSPFPKDLVSSAPKVPAHFEPAGDDRDALCSHYGVRLAGL